MIGNHKILIVDDDADDRDIMKDAFDSSNKEFIFIENGDQLFDYLEASSSDRLPSLILLDLNMPGKDGRTSLKEIKSTPHLMMIPTVVMTTSSSPRDKAMSYELGANCFVTKPDTFDKLTELARCFSRLWLS